MKRRLLWGAVLILWLGLALAGTAFVNVDEVALARIGDETPAAAGALATWQSFFEGARAELALICGALMGFVGGYCFRGVFASPPRRSA